MDLKEEQNKFIKRIVLALDNLDWDIGAWQVFAAEMARSIAIAYREKKVRKEIFPRVITPTYYLAIHLDIKPFFEGKGFIESLGILQHVIASLRALNEDSRLKLIVDYIKEALSQSQIDLGVRFNEEEGGFYPSGAKLLDEQLVNENLKWLEDYPKVSQPYDKGLQFFLEARNDSKKLEEVVSNIYKALEGFSHIVCGNTDELTDNQEIFLKKLGLSKNLYFKNIFKNYLNYANKFRHAEGDPEYHPELDYSEVEAFVYMTGLFIRLGIGKLKQPPHPTAREV